jgi:predicted nucleotidyltransferase
MAPEPLEEKLPLKDNENEAIVTLDTLRREKKAEILRLAELHGCHNVRVFGSVATGESRPDSDVDILVDLDGGRGLLDLGGLLSDLQKLLGTDVDVVESGCIHPYIRNRVLDEAVPL